VKLEYCKDCKYLANLIALGLGPRCNHGREENLDNLPPIISEIIDCKNREMMEKKDE